jgi:hypothetical protein
MSKNGTMCGWNSGASLHVACLALQEKPAGSLHHGGDDEQLHLKSAKEEANLRVAMARLAQAQNMNLAQPSGLETAVSVN